MPRIAPSLAGADLLEETREERSEAGLGTVSRVKPFAERGSSRVIGDQSAPGDGASVGATIRLIRLAGLGVFRPVSRAEIAI
jgi:hypothetical protein